MRDAIVAAILALLVREAITIYIEVRSRRPRRHKLRGNYFDARQPFAIKSVGGSVTERSDDEIEKCAQRLGRLRERRWSDADAEAASRR